MKVGVDSNQLEELQYLLKMLVSKDLPNTEKAMADGAAIVRDTWKEFALGGPLPGITEPLKRPNRAYADSIRLIQTGPFSYEIFSESKIAEQIENGTKELDMKTTHPYGPRSRVSDEGFPYLIVPMLWGTEEGTARVGPRNIVPKSLLKMMRDKDKFRASKVKSETIQSPNYAGKMVDRHTYKWGSRVKGSEVQGTAEQQSLTNGMVRFEVGKKGRRYGSYLTFRVISAKQLVTKPYSWIRPATPPRHVVQAVAENTKDYIEEMVENAIKGDLGK
jgi:hypothetical protein